MYLIRNINSARIEKQQIILLEGFPISYAEPIFKEISTLKEGCIGMKLIIILMFVGWGLSALRFFEPTDTIKE